MRYTELTEGKKSKGTFVGVQFGPKTKQRLVEWIDDNDVKNPIDPEDLHITLICDKEKEFQWDPETYDPMLKIMPDSYKFEQFGDCFVMRFDCPELSEKHFAARDEHNIKWDFDDYISHVTFSYDSPDTDFDEFDYPTFPLYLMKEYVTPYDDDFNSEKVDESAVGRIVQGVNTTADVKPGEIKRQAKKFGNDVDEDGKPTRTMWEKDK